MEEFDVGEVVGPQLAPSWKVAPMQPTRIVTGHVVDEQDPGAARVRRLSTARWGLVPAWSKDPSKASRMINARMETVTEKPAYRRAAAKRRLIAPADGYYEWQALPGAKRKVPYFLHAPDGFPLAMAGLYEYWTDRSLPEDHPHRVLCTMTVLTTRASDALGHVHDRSPVVLPPSLWAAWLDPALTDLGEVQALLEQVPNPRLQPDVVSTAAGNVRYDGPELVTPVTALSGAQGP